MSNAKKTTKLNQTPEEIQAAVAAAVQKLVAQGKKEGMIRAADLNAQLEKLQLTPEKIEEIYDQFDAMNIPVPLPLQKARLQLPAPTASMVKWMAP